jgi:dihydroxy-acid dehydratase
MIELDVPGRRLNLDVTPDELERRRAAWLPPASPVSGYQSLYVQNVLQADEGADFGFLAGPRGAGIPRNSH